MNSLMGVGYRAPFSAHLDHGHSKIGWLEIITENYLWDRGLRLENLERLRARYEVAFHGVSLSLAAPDELDEAYILELKDFCDRLQPIRVSDHLCWSSTGHHFWHDLLPFPYTKENLERIRVKVSRWQDILKRPLVLENLSAYVQARESEMSEYEFLAKLASTTGCQLLLDLNNMVVNARNFGINAERELRRIDIGSVAQVHLAGFVEGKDFLIDTHSTKPHEETWELWRWVCQKRKNVPFMLEWDSDLPDFEVVEAILQKAQDIQDQA